MNCLPVVKIMHTNTDKNRTQNIVAHLYEMELQTNARLIYELIIQTNNGHSLFASVEPSKRCDSRDLSFIVTQKVLISPGLLVTHKLKFILIRLQRVHNRWHADLCRIKMRKVWKKIWRQISQWKDSIKQWSQIDF